MKRPVVAVLATAVAIASLVSASPAVASNTSSIFGVSATVQPSATVSSTNLSFGPYTGARVLATSAISVTATAAVGYSINIDGGRWPNADGSRKLIDTSTPAHTLTYQLCQDSGLTTRWGPDTGWALDGTGTGSPQPFTVYGAIPPGQNSAPVGNYSDSLTVTVTY